MKTVCLGVLAAVVVVTGLVQAQAPERLPSFEVASVKENTSGDTRARAQTLPGGRLIATNLLLKGLIAEAYGGSQPLHLSRVLGGPDWIGSTRYDINAKAGGEWQNSFNGPPTELRLMLRSLLEDRFKLRSHHDTRELPVYELVIARADGRLGPQLRPTDLDCDALAAARRAGTPPAPRGPNDPPPCESAGGPARILSGGITMQQLALAFTQRLATGLGPIGDQGRLVIDKTGLTGRFAFDLRWTPDPLPAGQPPPGVPPIDPNGPGLFTAVQEQLGLKLQPATGPVDVLVIDSIERPTPD